MIIDAFDNLSDEIIKINPTGLEKKVDACIITFSNTIFNYVLENYKCEKIGDLLSSNGSHPVYYFIYEGKTIAFYMSFIGGPGCVGDLEETRLLFNTNNYIIFGGAGCLNKEIARGKLMIPNKAYRDEGISYHYKEASSYLDIKNHNVVSSFMDKYEIPYVKGYTWTTDAFYRETRGNFEKRKNEGCISVEMECASIQAMCDFRKLNAYFFFSSGDLLDAPKWDTRMKDKQIKNTQHDSKLFEIALELAVYVSTLDI